MKLKETGYEISPKILQFWEAQIVHNHGRNSHQMDSISAEELWCAAHGKPAIPGLIDPAQALDWVLFNCSFEVPLSEPEPAPKKGKNKS